MNIGTACKDYQTNAVSRGGGNEAFDAAFGQVKSRHAHIFGQHAVAHIESHHHIHTFRLNILKTAAHFGIQPTDDRCAEGPSPEQEPPGRSEQTIRRKHRGQALVVGELRNGPVSPSQKGHHAEGRQPSCQKQGPHLPAMQGQTGHHGNGQRPASHSEHPEHQLGEQQGHHDGADGSVHASRV